MIPKAIPMEIRHIVFLLIFFILYVIFGGIIFMLLEWPDEQIKRKEIDLLLKDFTEHIRHLQYHNNTANNNQNNNQNYFTEQKFRKILHELLIAQDHNLIDSYGNQQSYVNWSFINSFFFAITVITTIGYGHLTPRTIMGKIFCIIYALFGIPITSLLIGSVADRFSKLYSSPKKLPRGLKRATYQRQLSARFLMLRRGLISLVPWFFTFLVVPAWIFRYIEGWSFLDGFYYCFVTLSTIGFGDFVAGSFEKNYIWIYKILIVFWIIFGLAYLSMILNFITNSLRSRRISNVMNSLRVKINNSNNSNSIASRLRRHNNNNNTNNIEHHHHFHHYHQPLTNPSTTTMMTIYNDQKFINNNFIINNNNNNNDFDNYKQHDQSKMNLLHAWKIFKSKRSKNSFARRKSNQKCKTIMRQTTSLPELSECIVRTQQIATITIV
ncbi:hypothetical protein DERP_006236 [Dermatophagoides pteronyssinus]|uniref:Potassium channel domain-containing protein n=1 Tax=Dermatophagoides pteronyssinus TaxID=6956 RepID=A0ABQ8IXU9_DERPT|nr:hypothetical protein DERP_006236 [Dermatophagoides pteronyssinus]